MAFKKEVSGGVAIWVGTPDCQAAHDSVLDWLSQYCGPFRQTASESDDILRGNLGESISFCVGFWNGFDKHSCFSANAHRPFNSNSTIDFDLAWVHFGRNPSHDTLFLQEVKTTSGLDLAYARRVLDDYQKLFDTNPRLTLTSRAQNI